MHSAPTNPPAEKRRLRGVAHSDGGKTGMRGHVLLRAAAYLLGGTQALAARLGIGEALLVRFMVGRRKVPDPLLLKVIDVLEELRVTSANDVTYQPPDAPSQSSRVTIESRNGQGAGAAGRP